MTIVPILLALLELTYSAVVLPRPPSSPNHIQQDRKIADHKLYNEKPLHGQSTNVEKPNTDDYKLLEIELHGNDLEAVNFQNLLQAVMKKQMENSNPEPEVVPHSDLGVRNVGSNAGLYSKKFVISEDREILADHPKGRGFDEKLYYLKNGKPKVYINIRSQNGGLRKSMNDQNVRLTTSYAPNAFLQSAQSFDQTNKRYATKSYRPKKYYSDPDRMTTNRDNFLQTARDLEAKDVDLKTKSYDSVYGSDELPTTQYSMVTSSELPKQIPAPPNRMPIQTRQVQTTPVQKYVSHRTDILPSYRL